MGGYVGRVRSRASDAPETTALPPPRENAQQAAPWCDRRGGPRLLPRAPPREREEDMQNIHRLSFSLFVAVSRLVEIPVRRRRTLRLHLRKEKAEERRSSKPTSKTITLHQCLLYRIRIHIRGYTDICLSAYPHLVSDAPHGHHELAARAPDLLGKARLGEGPGDHLRWGRLCE